MAKTLPGKVIRGTTRTGIGGGIVLIALALYFFFRGFGPGGTGATGSGTGSISTSGGKDMITTSVPATGDSSGTATSLAAPDRIKGGLTADEKKALSGDVLTVLIDEHDYLIELPGSPDPIFRPTPMDRIIELAGITAGDTNGTRVRILRRQTSRASAEKKLTLELERHGVHRDAIVMPSEFVP